MNTEGWGEAVRDGLAEGMRRAEEARNSPHNPWPDGVINALDMPEPEPRTALARWDAAEGLTGHRHLQPLVEDQSRFCLHPSSDHGFLGCNTCGCPRSEDDHLGELCRWPAHEEAGAREPWFWRPGMHMDRYPHGMAFEPRRAEPAAFRAWTGSVADLMGDPRNNLATLHPLGPEGEKREGGLELLGPFHLRHEHGRMVEFIAWGGVSRDPLATPPHPDPECHEVTGVRFTKYNADGTLGETVYMPDARVTVCFAAPEVDTGLRRALANLGPVVQSVAKAFVDLTAPICHATYALLTGLHPWKGKTGKVPPCKGLTRRQRAARRRIHRRRLK